MTKGGALINLGDLSKPATVLIEKISDAVGIVYLPHQIKRVARAEAEADKIKALAQIEISDIQHRALIRMVQEEGKKQENIESISAKAIGDLKQDAKPEDIEGDWLAGFFDKCKLVSDQEMQSVWGKILAGEANRPGSFSKRTIEIISSLDKKDAYLFTALCRFAWNALGATPLVFDLNNAIYKKYGITFDVLTHLETLGLLRFEAQIGGFARVHLPRNITVSYFGIPINLEFPLEEGNQLEIGAVLLSQAGRELAPISGAHKIAELPEYVVTHWVNNGIKVYSSWPNQ